jgi:ketosteroid isomerase-like protein
MERPDDLVDNVELVRRFYAALNAHDLDGLLALCDDEIVYVNPADAAESGTRIGTEPFRRAFGELLAGFDGFRCEIEEIAPVGNKVVVVARSTGSGRISGIPFDELHRHVLACEGGRITSFRWFRTAD